MFLGELLLGYTTGKEIAGEHWNRPGKRLIIAKGKKLLNMMG
jgi:hypothetical protein